MFLVNTYMVKRTKLFLFFVHTSVTIQNIKRDVNFSFVVYHHEPTEGPTKLHFTLLLACSTRLAACMRH